MDLYFDGKRIETNIEENIEELHDDNIKLPDNLLFSSSLRVKDEVRGYLIHNGTDWDFVLCQTHAIIKNNSNKTKTTKRIALILESPHKDEYDKQYRQICPANGATGIKIKGGVSKYSSKWQLSQNYDYEIKLINAVRYQCSCYHDILQPNGINRIIKPLKEAVFKDLFTNLTINGKNSLIYRLEQYRPNIIVNACTDGKEVNLSGLVENEIKQSALRNIPYYSIPHPSSSWWGVSGIK